jgi:hypothetical protein
MQLAFTLGLFVATLACAFRSAYWYETAPLHPEKHPYLRCIAWGVAALGCVLAMHPLWEALK